jgi:hypothetical protein
MPCRQRICWRYRIRRINVSSSTTVRLLTSDKHSSSSSKNGVNKNDAGSAKNAEDAAISDDFGLGNKNVQDSASLDDSGFGETVTMIVDIAGYPDFGELTAGTVSSATYSISGSGGEVSGVIGPRPPGARFSYDVVVPPGEEYVATITAKLVIPDYTCNGVSKPFNVIKGVNTRINIVMECITADGFIFGCPSSMNISFTPPSIPMGRTIWLFAELQDSDATVSWSGQGKFSDPANSSTSYECISTGPQTISLLVGSSVNPKCKHLRSVDIECLDATQQPPFSKIQYSIRGQSKRTMSGEITAESSPDGLYADIGEMAPGNYTLHILLSEQWALCQVDNGGSSEQIVTPFSVEAGETKSISTMLKCDGAYRDDIRVTIIVHGVAESCNAPTAFPQQAEVGESIVLSWDTRYAKDIEVEADPHIAGSWETNPAAEKQNFKCLAAGPVTISFSVLKGPCTGFYTTIDITCIACEGQNCCPIDDYDIVDNGCADLGGSPPCYRGCQCMRNGGSMKTQLDSNDCLRWILTTSEQKVDAGRLETIEKPIVCLDDQGNPNPDPRPL